MNVTCPACAARYRIDDAKVRGRTARMRCKACATEWMASADSASPSIPPQASTPPQKMAEPSRAARVRTGKERERRDLFATQHTEDVPAPSARPSARPGPSYGARNENSVLFTVESLKAASVPPPARAGAETPAWTAASVGASAPPPPAVEDHEGIIDLKALSGSVAPRAMPNMFQSDTANGGFARAVEAAKSGGDPPFVAHLKGLVRTANPRIAGAVLGGVAALVAIGFGLSAVFGGDVAHKLASADLAQTRVSAVAAMVATRAEEAASAKTVLAAMPAAEAHPATTTAKPASKAHYVWRASSPTHTTTVSSPPKPRKSADTCGCHGDFNCILRCSAKGK